jgi:hypothetical protein
MCGACAGPIDATTGLTRRLTALPSGADCLRMGRHILSAFADLEIPTGRTEGVTTIEGG